MIERIIYPNIHVEVISTTEDEKHLKAYTHVYHLLPFKEGMYDIYIRRIEMDRFFRRIHKDGWDNDNNEIIPTEEEFKEEILRYLSFSYRFDRDKSPTRGSAPMEKFIPETTTPTYLGTFSEVELYGLQIAPFQI